MAKWIVDNVQDKNPITIGGLQRGKTAIQLAIDSGHQDIADYIRSKLWNWNTKSFQVLFLFKFFFGPQDWAAVFKNEWKFWSRLEFCCLAKPKTSKEFEFRNGPF